MTRRWMASAVGAMVLLGACGGGTRDTPPAPDSAVVPSARELEVELPGTPATTYRAGPEDHSTSVLARRIERSLPSLRVAVCLERAASAYAHAVSAQGESLPLAFAEFALHWAGCPDPSAAVTVLLTDRDEPEVLADNLMPMVGEEGFTHIGAARVPATEPYRWRWVALLVKRRFHMAPAPTSADPGGDYSLQFRIDAEFTSAEVVVTQPGGDTREYPVGLANGWVVAAIPLAAEVGREWIELIATGGAGPEVLALFPVEVGQPPPRRWVGSARADESWVVSTEQAEALVRALVARDRERFGLPVLVEDPELAEVARRHSEDMAATGSFAHVSKSSGAVMDRLEAAGYGARHAAENLARGAGLADAHDGLMRSPGHRAAILGREASHLGVGVAVGAGSGTERLFYITQIFARPVAGMDPASLASAVRTRIEGRRSSLGLAASDGDRDLDRISHRLAAALARQRLDSGDIEDFVSSELQRLGLHGVRWRVVYGEAFEADDVEVPAEVDGPRAPLLGIGCVQAAGGQSHRPATYAILVVEGG